MREHLKRLPDFDNVEREEDALRLAERHAHTLKALTFLTSWPDLRRAGAQVRIRQVQVDGLDGDLRRQVETLARRDPLAAVLLLRVRISALLARRRNGVYAAAPPRAGLRGPDLPSGRLGRPTRPRSLHLPLASDIPAQGGALA